ncbi:MAG: tail fiber domain-containing protein, partial [Haliscomenobacter sp.]
GTPVWSETQDGVEVIGGVYSALLGAANPLNAGFNTVYYLGIAVDGGQELTPRTRLTSAPYALSLIGQSNTFPSAGSVGVGTVTPDAGASLHVHKADGHVQQIISTTADYGASLGLKAGDNHSGYLDVNQYAFAMYSPDKSINIIPTGNDGRVHLYGNGKLKAYTENYGFRVVGRQDIYASEEVPNPFISWVAGGYYSHITQFNSGTFQIFSPGSANYMSNGRIHIHGDGGLRAYTDGEGWVVNGRLHATGKVVGSFFESHSDARIKKDVSQSIGTNDLSTLMNIQVMDYRYVDSLSKGKATVKGFIAQQVATVYPQAVTKSVGFLPDILANASVTYPPDGDATLKTDKVHGLSVGDRVRIQVNGTQKDLPVVQTPSAESFMVRGWEKEEQASTTAFVYGKEISDFHTVDYDKIHTLNVSATQELARRVAQLEAENAALRQQNGKMEGQIQGLRTQVDQMESLHARLSKLESLISSTVNR